MWDKIDESHTKIIGQLYDLRFPKANNKQPARVGEATKIDNSLTDSSDE